MYQIFASTWVYLTDPTRGLCTVRNAIKYGPGDSLQFMHLGQYPNVQVCKFYVT